MKTPEEIKLEKAIKDMKKIKSEDVFLNVIKKWTNPEFEHRHLVKISDDVYRDETDEEYRNRLLKKIEYEQDLEHFEETSKTRELNSFEKGIKEEIERLLKEELQ